MSEPFGTTPDGAAARLYTLDNGQLRARITDWGGRLVALEAPDRAGRRGDVVLGFASVEDYARNGGGFGALLGRNANRIAGGRFELDGRTYELSRNEGPNTLHGGKRGFDKLSWEVEEAGAERLVLTHTSPDGDQGFPGEMRVRATWRLEADTLWLEFAAETTKPTIASLSAHPYFNLGDHRAEDVLGHELTVFAEEFLPTDKEQIPTGEIRAVAGTPFDFRSAQPIGARIRHDDEQLVFGLGYDHCYVVSRLPAETPRLMARLRHPGNGRVLEIHSTQPGMQFYSGNKLQGSFGGHGGALYRQSAGLAFEPQGFPDAPHHPNFPSTVLRPGQRLEVRIGYRFTTG